MKPGQVGFTGKEDMDFAETYSTDTDIGRLVLK